MASEQDKGRAAGKAARGTTRRSLDLQSEVGQPRDSGELRRERGEEASYQESISPRDYASLQRAFRVNPRGTSKRIVESHDPAYAPSLTSLLRAVRIVRDAAARGLAQIEFMGPPSLLEPLESFGDISAEELYRIWDVVETSDEDSLRKTFYANPSLADSLTIAALMIPPVASAVIPLFETSLEETLIVSLHVAHALAWISDEPERISETVPIALGSAAALLDRPGSSDAIAVIESLMELRPLAVLPYLCPVLQKSGGGPGGDALLATVDRVIFDGFRVPDGSPAEARHLTLSLLGDLLRDDAVDESLRKKVEAEVRSVVRSMPGDMSSAIEEVSEASGVPAERIAWALWGDLLTNPDRAQQGWVDPHGAEWVIRHLSGNEGAPWTWSVYDHIVHFSPEPEFRIEAVKRLGEFGPTSILDPLPADVQDLHKLLERLSEHAENPQLRREAGAALARNRVRGEESVRETRISICAPALGSLAVPSSECATEFIGPPRLPIQLNLTIIPGLGESLRVPRMDASQEVSRRPISSPDLGLLSHQVTTNVGGDGLSPALPGATATGVPADRDLANVSFTTEDPAVLRLRTLMVSEPDDNEVQMRPEQKQFKDRYQVLGPLVESGQIDAAALDAPMKALNEVYRELDGEVPPSKAAETQRVIGVPEAAEILELSEIRVRQRARKGLIGKKIAGRYLFSREELEADRHRERSKGGRPRKNPD